MGGKITNMTGSNPGVPSAITRDRLNFALGDLPNLALVNMLAEKGVATSIGTLQAIRTSNVDRVRLDLAVAIRRLADTYTPPVDETIAYLDTAEAKAFIAKCRRPRRRVAS